MKVRRQSARLLILFVVTISFASAIQAQKLTTPREEKLLNGLKILMWPDASRPNVSVSIRVHSGSAFDPQGKEGVMRLLADSLFPNEATREFFRDDLGGELKVRSTYDMIQVDASSQASDYLQMLETLGSALTNPPLERELTDRLKTQLISELNAKFGTASYTADDAVARRLLGQFPYGRPLDGTAASVSRVVYADLVDAKNKFLVADNATLTITGNFDRVEALRALRRLFGAWLKGDRRVPASFRQPDPPPTAIEMLPSPEKDRAAIRFAMRGVARSDRSFASCRVYAKIAEARLRSIVPSAASESVHVRCHEQLLPGTFVVGFDVDRGLVGSENGKVNALDLLAKLFAERVNSVEFESARSKFASEWASRPLTEFWLDADTFRTGTAEAELAAPANVTAADVQAFADRIASSPAAVVIVTTPASQPK